jgi:hypothetical protein
MAERSHPIRFRLVRYIIGANLPVGLNELVTMTRQALAGVAAALAVFACRQSGAPTTITSAHTAGGAEVFEPTIAIDPANPDRILAAGMFGVPFGRGGTGIWLWRSIDGGRSWADRALEPPRIPGVDGTPASAADVIAGFADDGTPLVASMSAGQSFGATFVSRLDSEHGTSVPVYRNAADSAAKRRVLYDKPWLALDHGSRSPRRGSIYLSVGAVTAGLGPAGMGVDWKPIGSRVLFAASRDGGRTFSSPTSVGDSSAFGGYLAIEGDGAIDVVYERLTTKDGAGDAVFHRRSSDGGATFDPPVTIGTTTGDTLLELPLVAARPNGDLMACWSQGIRGNERNNEVRCAGRKAGGSWSAARAIDVSLPPGAVAAWPAVAGTDRGWYLLLYVVGQARTEVALFTSGDGARFAKLATLAANDSLGIDRFCVVGSTPCRRTRTDGFAIGDYVSLDAKGGRLAAAYVLPRPAPGTGAAVYITTLAEPRL